MTESSLPPEFLRALDKEVAHLDPRLRKAFMESLAVSTLVASLEAVLKAIPAIGGEFDLQRKLAGTHVDVSTPMTLYEYVPKRSHEGECQRAWEKLRDCFYLHNSTLLAMKACATIVCDLLSDETDTSAHDWAERYGSELLAAFAEGKPTPGERNPLAADRSQEAPGLTVVSGEGDQEVAHRPWDPSAAWFLYSLMGDVERDADAELEKWRRERATAEDEPRPHLTLVSDPEPLASDPRPAADIVSGTDSETPGGTRRHRWGLADLCAALVLVLIACGVVTHRAQKQAQQADARAAQAIEEARQLRDSPVIVGVRRHGEENEIVRSVRPDGQILVGDYTITVRSR